jgi:phage-related protein
LRVQNGLEPLDVKPFPSVGAGVQELRVWASSGTFRVIYYARLENAVYVLHAFEKKTQQTSERDVGLARRRLMEVIRQRRQD